MPHRAPSSDNRVLHETMARLYKDYKLPQDKEEALCFYCKLPSDTIDYAPSLKVAYALGEKTIEDEKIPLYRVKCCRECNSTLSVGENRIYIWSRAAWIYAHYLKRYERILSIKVWSEKDFNDFGPNMQEYILQGYNQLEILGQRLKRILHISSIAAEHSKISSQCDYCGTSIRGPSITKKGLRRRFCSAICRTRWWNAPETAQLGNNPRRY